MPIGSMVGFIKVIFRKELLWSLWVDNAETMGKAETLERQNPKAMGKLQSTVKILWNPLAHNKP